MHRRSPWSRWWVTGTMGRGPLAAAVPSTPMPSSPQVSTNTHSDFMRQIIARHRAAAWECWPWEKGGVPDWCRVPWGDKQSNMSGMTSDILSYLSFIAALCKVIPFVVKFHFELGGIWVQDKVWISIFQIYAHVEDATNIMCVSDRSL